MVARPGLVLGVSLVACASAEVAREPSSPASTPRAQASASPGAPRAASPVLEVQCPPGHQRVLDGCVWQAAHPASGAGPAASGDGFDDQPPGFLTVVCDPACDDVAADGQSLGASPVVHASLAPGRRRLVMRRAGASTRTITVTVVAGETNAQRVSMPARSGSAPGGDVFLQRR